MRTLITAVVTTSLILMGYPVVAEANEGVAKAIIVKGKVNVILKDGTSKELAKDEWLPEGSKVKTEAGSFAKLLFIDKSSMNVGPSSAMEIASFPKSEAGVINLLQGEVRSKVTKNYMDMKDKDKSKLFIKTKTAAMGVRGTDFIVGFNPQNAATLLDVVSGTVAMAPIDPNLVGNIDQRALEAVVSSPNAVMVEKGMGSEVGSGASRPAEPKPIPPTKLETLKTNENAVSTNSAPVENKAEGKGEQKSEAKAENKAESKGEMKSEAKAENKAEDKAESKAESKAEAKAESKGDAPKAAVAVLPPGLSAKMAVNSAPAAGGPGPAPTGDRAPASVGPAPTAGPGSAPPPPPTGGVAPPPPPTDMNAGAGAGAGAGAPPPPPTDVVVVPQCSDLCQCYAIGCNVAMASGGGGAATGSIDGNVASSVSNSITQGAATTTTTTIVSPTATVQLNITTQ